MIKMVLGLPRDEAQSVKIEAMRKRIWDRLAEEIKRRPMCSCLIDQGRYIGEDPIGHACCNVASGTHLLKVDGVSHEVPV